MSGKAHAISSAVASLYRIEALAFAIENMTDELRAFSSGSAMTRGLTKEVSHTIYQLAGMLREMTEQAINCSHEIQENAKKR